MTFPQNPRLIPTPRAGIAGQLQKRPAVVV
jgi:hypothetical protein